MNPTNRPTDIALTANTDWALYNFRKGLMTALIEQGRTIEAVCSDTGFMDALAGVVRKAPIRVKDYRKNVDAVQDLKLFFEYYRIYRRVLPKIVHHFTIKPVIYGSMAARAARVPIIVNTVTGLGYVFTDGAKNRLPLRFFTQFLYRLSGLSSDYTIFENPHDREFFLKKALLSEKKCEVVPGCGVNNRFFSRDAVDPTAVARLKNELDIRDGSIVLLLVSRMLYDKGIREFVDAVRPVVREDSRVRALLVGPPAFGNPAAIPEEQLASWEKEGVINYLGRRRDIRELLFLSDVVVLPSYREGLPKSLLEASAMAKPMITTDAVGCKDVVIHGQNGILVPAKDADSLRKAILFLLNDAGLREKMGAKARERALGEFDENGVIERTLQIYEKVQRRKGIPTT